MHDMSRDWFESTGDSFVTETVDVYNPRGMGSYLGKYVTKAFGQRKELEGLGFSRRYTTSRGWPGKRSRLAGSTDESGWSEWRKVERQNKKYNPGTYDKVGSAAALERVEPLLNKRMRLGAERKQFKDLRESFNDSEDA